MQSSRFPFFSSYEMRITEKGWNDSFYRVMFVYTNILILLNK